MVFWGFGLENVAFFQEPAQYFALVALVFALQPECLFIFKPWNIDIVAFFALYLEKKSPSLKQFSFYSYG